MVFNGPTRKTYRKQNFKIQKNTDLIKPKPIDNFLGQSRTTAISAMPLGQLIENKNMEYKFNGGSVYLETKRGSTMLTDITNRTYGAGIYKYNFGNEYIILVDSTGALKYYDIEGNTLSSSLASKTAGVETEFLAFGQGSISLILGCNANDALFKVSGEPPIHGTITNAPTFKSMAFSSISNRLIGVIDHIVYYSKIQTSQTSLSNLTDFNWNVSVHDNTILVSADDGNGFQKCIELNTMMLLFKDSGIWAIPNTTEADTDWRVPKVSSDTGTKSPKTVHLTQYGNSKGVEGVIFLGTDKTLRIYFGELEYNAGKIPTISNKKAHNISKHFQTILDKIPDGLLGECTAKYHGRYYILNIPGSSNSTELDTSIYIDTEKLLSKKHGEDAPQPYWFESSNVDYTNMVTSKTSNKLYGLHKDGFIVQALVENKFYEEFPARVIPSVDYNVDGSLNLVAIEWSAYTGWHKFSDKILRLHALYLSFELSGGWGVNVHANSFTWGGARPDYIDGSTKIINQEPTGNSDWFYLDISLLDVGALSGSNTNTSKHISLSRTGNYFLFGFSGSNQGESAIIYGVHPLFKVYRNDFMGLR